MNENRWLVMLAIIGALAMLLGLLIASFLMGAAWERERTGAAGEQPSGSFRPGDLTAQTQTAAALVTTPTPDPNLPTLTPSATPPFAPSISGFVWHDVCANAAFSGPGEGALPPGCLPGNGEQAYRGDGLFDANDQVLPGVIVDLAPGPCDPLEARLPLLTSVTTGPDGRYTFNDLPVPTDAQPATYCVSINPVLGPNAALLSPGLFTYPADGSGARTVTLQPGTSIEEADFAWDFEFLPVEGLSATPTPPMPPIPGYPAPSQTSGPAPATAIPTAIRVGSPTPTPTVPTPVPSATPVFCDSASLVSHLGLPLNAFIPIGEDFVKTWRIKNTGSCTWNKDYDLVFINGTAMTTTLVIPLTGNVLPNGAVDLTLKLVAPIETGTYVGNWLLRNQFGALFGTGSLANTPFPLQIQTITAVDAYALDIASSACLATWRNANSEILPCPGEEDTEAGFLRFLSAPVLETGLDNELTLWVRPDNRTNGQVSATFPFYSVETGDRLRAWIGCLPGANGNENEDCFVTFQVDYLTENGALRTLGSWQETLNGQSTELSIDLSSLANTDIQLILRVKLDPDGEWEDADAYWFAPRIQR